MIGTGIGISDSIDETNALSQLRPQHGYWLTRALILRGIGLVYAVAFVILVRQGPGLLGSRGILPAAEFLDAVGEQLGSRGAGFWRLPSVFWLGVSDPVLIGLAWVGLALSLAVLGGVASAPVLALLWALYLSFVHVGQIFYGYGWESLLCEAGFLAIFLAPPLGPSAFSERSRPPLVVMVLYRWLLFRLMLGAGLIKLRGDPCWTDLTCLRYHYETQPNPGPLSPFFHRLPMWMNRGSVLFNHVVEVVAPFGAFGPRRLRLITGALVVLFQLTLIASGNLSFLNWITLVLAFACFDDEFLVRCIPRRLAARPRLGASLRALAAHVAALANRGPSATSKVRRGVLLGLAFSVGALSIAPIVNLASSRQAMNTSFDPFDLVNSYGAFGSISRERLEVVVQGTASQDPDDDGSYLDYEFPCKPGDPERSPCLVTPYHYRLDWQMWFLPFDLRERPRWFLRFVAKLLTNEPAVTRLLRVNPFPDEPPRFVRARLYRYRFTNSGELGTWHRELLGTYLAPVSRADQDFLQ